MTAQRIAPVSNGSATTRPNVIKAAGLAAEYSTGCTPTGEWFALGTILREGTLTSMPAWVVVGTGTTRDEAVSNLATEISAQAHGSARI